MLNDYLVLAGRQNGTSQPFDIFSRPILRNRHNGWYQLSRRQAPLCQGAGKAYGPMSIMSMSFTVSTAAFNGAYPCMHVIRHHPATNRRVHGIAYLYALQWPSSAIQHVLFRTRNLQACNRNFLLPEIIQQAPKRSPTIRKRRSFTALRAL